MLGEKAQRVKSTIKFMLCTAAVALLSAAITPCALGQEGDSDEPPRRECERAVGRERQKCEREAGEPQLLMALGIVVSRPGQCCESQLPLAQIREDLTYLNAIHTYLSQSALRIGNLDFKAVAKSASEIRKRADRLIDNLALPDSEKGAERTQAELLLGPERLREALSTLSALISGAVLNPVIRGGYVLDIGLSVKARRDLDEIVALSKSVGRSCESFNKAAR